MSNSNFDPDEEPIPVPEKKTAKAPPDLGIRVGDFEALKSLLSTPANAVPEDFQPTIAYPQKHISETLYYNILELQDKIRQFKPNDRSEIDRQIAIILTDLEGVEARWAHFVQGR